MGQEAKRLMLVIASCQDMRSAAPTINTEIYIDIASSDDEMLGKAMRQIQERWPGQPIISAGAYDISTIARNFANG